jgi:hypothetical protein
MKRNEPILMLGKGNNYDYDFYRTPGYCLETLLKRERFSGNVIDPCAGDGAMIKYFKNGIGFDIQPRKKGIIKLNFLKYNARIDNIVMNPPFNKAMEFIIHSLKLVDKKVCVLARFQLLESRKRYEKIWKDNMPKKIYFYSNRICFISSWGKIFGGGLNVAWFVFDKEYKGKTELQLINDKPSQVGYY